MRKFYSRVLDKLMHKIVVHIVEYHLLVKPVYSHTLLWIDKDELGAVFLCDWLSEQLGLGIFQKEVFLQAVQDGYVPARELETLINAMKQVKRELDLQELDSQTLEYKSLLLESFLISQFIA